MRGPMSELIDPVALQAYLTAHLPGFSGPLTFEKTPTGQSNPTFVLTAASGRYVLRRKPPGALLKSAHAIEREFRVMKALAGSDVPVPAMLHLCEDDTVLGTPFFVMEHVSGSTFNDQRCEGVSTTIRARIFDEMNATLARLHRVDVDAVGLGDFGKPGNYFARQLARWTGQYRATETENLRDMEALIDWLETNAPADDGGSVLVHGDFRMDNMLFDQGSGRIKALIDWELSTLGHPLADLGGQIMQWSMPVGEEGRGLEGVDRAALGIPADQAYAELYAKRVGRSDLSGLEYAIAFSFFRMAAILQGVKYRALHGNASNPESGLRMGATIPVMARKAIERLETSR